MMQHARPVSNGQSDLGFDFGFGHLATKTFIYILAGTCYLGAWVPAAAQSIDLLVTQVEAPASGQHGQSITVSNTVKNQGTANAGTFRIGFYLSMDNVITIADVFLGSRSVNSLAAGATSSENTSLTIPNSLTPGNYFLGVWVDDQGSIPESAENNNTATDAMMVLDPTAPDLATSTVDAPATAVPGEQILVANTVTNQGQSSAGFFEVGIYLSTDATINSSDQLLATRSLNSLAAGASNSSATVVVIPSITPIGNHFIGAWADYSGQILEANESNNIGTDAIVIETAVPDLIMSAISVPSSAAAGQTITVSNTVLNQGTGRASSFSIGIYLSSDTTITFGDLLLEIRSVNSLSPALIEAANTLVLIPTTVAPGNYSLGVWADNFQEVAEKNENNNKATRLFAVMAKPDLHLTTFTTPTLASPGQTFTVVNTVKNQGTAAAGAFRIGFYLSTDEVITTNDVLLGFRNVSQLAVDGLSSENTTLTIPASVALGNYFLGAWVDDQSAVDESVESNNTQGNSVQLIAPSPVDLVVTVADAPAQASLGQNITVANTLKNQGTAAAATFQVGIYLSTDNTITTADVFLGTRTVNSLAAGATDAANTTMTIPTTVAPGNYFIGVWADHFNAVNETNESNNTGVDAITIIGLPDLTVTAVEAPAQANSGQNITIANTIKNQGSAVAGAFQAGIYLSTDNLITTADVLLATRTVNSLAAGATDAANTAVTVPVTVTPGSYFIGVWADHLSAVPEIYENNNAAADAVSIVGQPDLTVTLVDAPAVLTSGQNAVIANTIMNQGSAAAGTFQGGIYLSTDNVITAADLLIGTRTVSSLVAGASDAANTTVSVPASMTPGNYFVGVWADHTSAVSEISESNNTATDAVAVGGQADLIVTVVDAPAQATIGQSITVANTIVNQGTLASGAFQVGIYLSTDNVVTTADVLIGMRTVTTLAVGGTDASNTAVTIPSTITPGNYFVGVWADHLNSVSESNETNNTAVDAITILGVSDLIVTAVDAPAQAYPGQSLTVTNTVRNQGSAAAATFQVAFYLSTDNIITSADLLLGTRTINSLGAGAADAANTTMTLPTGTVLGGYYLGVWADYLNTVAESNENNNTGSDAVAVVGQADLIVTLVNAPAQANSGQSLIVSNTLKNQGSGTANSFVVGIYLSSDTLITGSDRLLEIRSVNNLAAGASDAEDTEIVIPTNVPPGNYYLGVWADIFLEVSEIKEDNNTGRKAIAIVAKPDLVVSSLSAPASAAPGQTFSLSTTVKNQGTALASAYRLGFYLSTDSLVSTADLLLDFRNLNQLNAGNSTTENLSLMIPNTVAPGSYFLGVWADDQNAIEEAEEDNNTRKTALQILTPTPVDLVSIAVDAPAQANAGQTIPVANTVKNQGTAAAGAFQIGIYLSTDNVITSADVLLGTRTVNSLAVGAADAANTPVTIPASINPGNYFIGVWADYREAVVETDEGNNIATDAITIVGVGQPDLLISLLDTAPQANPGQRINVVNAIQNQGNAAAEVFQVGIYLSADNVITTSDALLETRVVNSLAAGASDTAITPVNIPLTVQSGNYFIGPWADYTNAVTETNEDNNTNARAIAIGGQADLIMPVMNVPAQIDPGQTMMFTNTVKNQGTLVAGNFVVGFYLSTDSIITAADRLLEVRSVNNLAAGAVDAAVTQVTIPASIAPSNYYVGAWADIFQEVSESKEDNNVVVRPVAIGTKADLVVTALTLPVSASPGHSLNVKNTVKNSGVLSAPAFRIGFYLSMDNVIDTADLPIGSRTLSKLDAGASNSENTLLNIPANVAVGNYFLGIWADDQNAVEEIADNNNTREEKLQLVEALPIDLVATSIVAPIEVNAGQSIMVQNTVKNQGTQAATTFRIGIYLSNDDLITISDILLATRIVNALGIAASDAANTSVTVPANVKSEKYFLAAWADDLNALFETNESNNIALDTITVVGKPNRPPIANAGGPYSTPHNRLVALDASASSDPDGDALSFLWQFGDGTSGNGATVTHFYTEDSLYTVILMVSDEQGEIAFDTTTVRVFNRPPVANANGPYTANRLSLLQFSSNGSSDPEGDILQYFWDFGDFSTGMGPAPKHLYSELDTVKVTLTVDDGHGGRATDTTTVFVVNIPPIAKFTPMQATVHSTTDTAHFDGSASMDPDGVIILYIWDFGDGSPPDSSGPRAWHLYKSLGFFPVTLRVTDNDGTADDTTTGLRVRVDSPEVGSMPDRFLLAQNYPNPFGNIIKGFSTGESSTHITYAVPVPAWVNLKIYNSLGQQVRTLVASQRGPGYHKVVWDGRDDAGRDLPSGIYFYEMQSRGVRLIRKIMVVR